MNRRQKFYFNEAGLGLVNILIGLAIASIVLVGIGKILVQSDSALHKNTDQIDLASLKLQLINSTNCDKTYQSASNPVYIPATPASAMKCSGPFRLLRKDGNEVIPNQKYGSWSVRATCEQDFIKVYYAQLKDHSKVNAPMNTFVPADFRVDRTNGKQGQWQEAVPGGISLCDLRADVLISSRSLTELRSLWTEVANPSALMPDCMSTIRSPIAYQSLTTLCGRWCRNKKYTLGYATECNGFTNQTLCICRH